MTWDGVEKRAVDGRIHEMERRMERLETWMTSELGGANTKGNVNHHLERIERLLQETTREIKESAKRMERIVLGEDGSMGLPSRVKILEGHHSILAKISWAALITAIGLSVNKAWAFLLHKQ